MPELAAAEAAEAPAATTTSVGPTAALQPPESRPCSPANALPHDILAKICRELKGDDVKVAAQIAQSWRRAARDAHPRLAGETLARALRQRQGEGVSVAEAFAQLAEVSHQCVQLAALRTLALVDLPLTAADVAAIAQRCPSLQRLDLEDNGLTSLPDAFWSLTDLTHLNLRLNQLPALPAQLGRLARLEELNLVGNRLAALPDVFADLGRLRVLSVSCNRDLQRWPPSLGEAKALREVHAVLTALPCEGPRQVG